jgi:hypothetical protein
MTARQDLISRKELGRIRDQAVALLQKALGDEFLVTYVGGHYGEVGDIKLEIVKRDADGRLVTSLEADFRRLAPQLGLDADDFGARFKSNGMTFEITGLKPKRWKYPIVAHNITTGQTYKMAEETVLAAKSRGGDDWQPAS